jgi:hypothetical protein
VLFSGSAEPLYVALDTTIPVPTRYVCTNSSGVRPMVEPWVTTAWDLKSGGNRMTSKHVTANRKTDWIFILMITNKRPLRTPYTMN